jgi:hypothetical protein
MPIGWVWYTSVRPGGALANDEFAVVEAFVERGTRVNGERDGWVVLAAAGGVAPDGPGPNAGEEMPIG